MKYVIVFVLSFLVAWIGIFGTAELVTRPSTTTAIWWQKYFLAEYSIVITVPEDTVTIVSATTDKPYLFADKMDESSKIVDTVYANKSTNTLKAELTGGTWEVYGANYIELSATVPFSVTTSPRGDGFFWTFLVCLIVGMMMMGVFEVSLLRVLNILFPPKINLSA